MAKAKSPGILVAAFHPWIYFPVFLAANLLLSYFSFSLPVKLEIGLWGLLLPFLAALLTATTRPNERPSFLLQDMLPPPSAWPWAGVFLLGIFLRLYHLVSLSTWPLPDEGIYARESMELSEKGIWHIFYTIRQHPPLFNWALGIFFKVFPPSLFSLWFFQALLGILALLAGGWAAWVFLPQSLAFVCLVLMATGFWPLYAGRICSNFNLSLLFELLAWGLLALFLRSPAPWQARKYALLLGLCAGLGLFTFVVWLVVAVSVVLAFRNSSGEKKQRTWGYFFIPLFFSAAVFFFLYIARSKVIPSIWAFRPGMEIGHQLLNSFSYLSALFWAGLPYCYGPLWGGLLNPVLGSLFFLGLVVCWRQRREKLHQWILVCLFLFLLPGLVSSDLETFRVIFVFPLLILTAVLGLGSLLAPLKKYRWTVALVLLAASASLDAYHLLGPYHDRWGHPGPEWSVLKSNTSYRAYLELEKIHEEKGPGAFLSGLRAVDDATLPVAIFRYDAAQNHRIAVRDANWTAVIVSMGYKPFLSKRFPGMDWYNLGKEHERDRILWWLGVIPDKAEGRPETLRRWREADQALQSLDARMMDPSRADSTLPVKDCFPAVQEAVKGDPFLETCFWEKMFFYYLVGEKNDEKAREAVRQLLKAGYPLPRFLEMKKSLERRG